MPDTINVVLLNPVQHDTNVLYKLTSFHVLGCVARAPLSAFAFVFPCKTQEEKHKNKTAILRKMGRGEKQMTQRGDTARQQREKHSEK